MEKTPDSHARPVTAKDRRDIAKWLETQRARPQARPLPPASRAVARAMKPLSKKFGSSSRQNLSQHWHHIVGERFAKISSPDHMVGGKNGRTLWIKAPGAAATLIMASSDAIISRLNSYLGPDHVARIRVTQTAMNRAKDTPHRPLQRGLPPSTELKLYKSLEHMPDTDLKAALAKLGRGVLTQSPSSET